MSMLRIASMSLAFAALLTAQVEPEHSATVPLSLDSGLVANTLTDAAVQGVPQVVWSTVVTVPGSAWLRLEYGGVLLAGAREPGRDGSFLRLTSMRDGAVMTQHLVHVEQWRDTSAYFNGDGVLVELLAHPGTGDNRFVLDKVVVGPSIGLDTICGTVDDRVLSFDNRVARNQPSGCTSWMIDDCNHCFLTAGHCAGGLNVIQFNVPLSTPGGSIQHPGPQDQYAVDAASMQTNGGQGVGNDWAYFGVFPNSTTQLTPFQAYGGQTFALLATPPPVSGQAIRVTGNGSTSAPVSPTWYLVQKTHAGPYANFAGTTIQYATDTTGGNSGSPVFVDGTNQALGIHTHGGCTSSGGANSGTGANLPALQAALANPAGVCDCPELEFVFPNGLPASVAPAGGTTLRVQITGPVALVPGTLQLHATTSAGAVTTQAVPVGPGLYDLPFPASTCGGAVPFHVSAQGVNLTTYTSPAGAPAARHTTVAANGVNTLRNYTFNSAPPGWSVVNTSLTSGAWVRAVPTDSRGPSADFDGSGQCWVTGNANNEDVDGGPTTLLTETIDLSAAFDPTVRFALWFENSTAEDRLRVDASNDNGANWTNVLDLAAFSDWSQHTLRVRNVFATPAQFKLRFVIADNPNNSVTEAAMDAFRLDDPLCTAASWSSYGAGCTAGGSAPALQLGTLPTLGGTFALTVQGLGAGVPVMIVGLAPENAPLALPWFAPGCTLLSRVDVAQVLAATGGSAPWSLAIPADPALQGIAVHQQALEIGASWTLSAGGVGVIR